MNRLAIEVIPNPQSLERQFVATFGISHIAYGSTPKECFANLKAVIWKMKP